MQHWIGTYQSMTGPGNWYPGRVHDLLCSIQNDNGGNQWAIKVASFCSKKTLSSKWASCSKTQTSVCEFRGTECFFFFLSFILMSGCWNKFTFYTSFSSNVAFMFDFSSIHSLPRCDSQPDGLFSNFIAPPDFLANEICIKYTDRRPQDTLKTE